MRKKPHHGGVDIWNYVKTCVFWYFRSFYCRYYFDFKINVSYSFLFPSRWLLWWLPCCHYCYCCCFYLFNYSFIHLFTYLFIYLLIYLFTYLFIYLFTYLFIYLLIYLFIYLFIYLSIYLFILLFLFIQTQVFSWEICKIFKNTYFVEHLRTTASDGSESDKSWNDNQSYNEGIEAVVNRCSSK